MRSDVAALTLFLSIAKYFLWVLLYFIYRLKVHVRFLIQKLIGFNYASTYFTDASSSSSVLRSQTGVLRKVPGLNRGTHVDGKDESDPLSRRVDRQQSGSNQQPRAHGSPGVSRELRL